jgi:protein tyrosine phosphatase
LEAGTKLAGLVSLGVTRVISFMEGFECNNFGDVFVDYTPVIAKIAAGQNRTIGCFRHPVVDGSMPSVEAMKAILDRIDEAIAAGGTAYIHCWGGRGRTGTAVCCWLVRHRLASPGHAVAHLQTLIKHNAAAFYQTPQNAEQRKFVGEWRPGE